MQIDRGASVASAARNGSRRARATAAVVGSVLLVACGQKGPLTLPEPVRAKPAAPAPAAAASAPSATPKPPTP